ncbi:MAG: histidine--tRNA ligase [Nanoarchaeota archaeon]|nr:histidine--tRNA ligase [Nanoarchaeota archaeon]
MELANARGVRDIDPQDQMLREAIVSTLTKIFQSYGFVPLDTPLIERYDVLSAKFAAGEESDAMKETYRLQDNGGRELGLRFDLTVPLSRYIGMNGSLKMPFKRYQIGKVFRDAPVRKGRYREFTQVDVDIIGAKEMAADATCIAIALDVFNALGIRTEIRINNRKFLSSLLASYGIDEKKRDSVLVTIDKLDKIGRDGVLKELEEKGIAERNSLLDDLIRTGTNEEKLDYFMNKQCNGEGIDELKEVLSYVDDGSVVFEPSLARGLAYYTGTVFEVYAKELDSAITGGGRYDDLIGSYLDGKKDYPAVGISFGLDRLVDVMKSLNDAEMSTQTKLLIVPLNTVKESFSIASRFRKAGINTDIDLMKRGPSKNLNNANQQGIPYVAIIGEDEVKENLITLKDLKSGEEKKLSVEDAIKTICRT